ncbi:MAG: methyl-accepting chemotaxis protein, partial [Mesorhizobium sp.]|nr:methyl-accepting chemotaxis protein [Mesorhizobium sp.]
MSDISNALGGVGLLRASLARTGRWAASLGFVAGIVSDILNPLAPFAAYIAMVAAVAAAIIASAIVFRLVLTTRAMPALVFATTTAAIAGGIYALQQNRSADNGVIASLIPAVAELQQSMGIVAARVEKIEQTVTETQKAVDGVKQSTDQIATRQDAQTEQIGEVKQSTDEIAAKQDAQAKQVGELQKSTEQIAVSIDAIAKGFAALAAQGSTLADPKRPDEFYHNARVQELGGDMVNARRSYLAFASFDIDAIDPYQRFATLLRVQDGRAGAREVFGELAGRGKSPAVKLVHALQFDDAQRIERLNAFIAANPAYAPGYYFLSKEHSLDRLGTQSLADKRAEGEALQTFLGYEKDGGLVKFFVDHTELAVWLDDSRRRLAALGNALDPASFAPTLIPTRSNQGWIISVSLPEAATAISWRMSNDGPYVDTGLMASIDQRTGKPMPNPSFQIPTVNEPTVISIRYVDPRGNPAGPFDLAFDPRGALQQANKQILDQFWTSWVAFDASGNTGLVYYTHILSYRCAVKEVRYSLNGDSLDKTLDMPPCNEKDPYALPDGV